MAHISRVTGGTPVGSTWNVGSYRMHGNVTLEKSRTNGLNIIEYGVLRRGDCDCNAALDVLCML